MVPINVSPSVSDCDSGVTCRIVSVTSNEPVEGLGDGDTSPDWVITGNLTDLRAERSALKLVGSIQSRLSAAILSEMPRQKL